MRTQKQRKESETTAALAMQQFLDFSREENSDNEKGDMMAFIFLIILGIFVITCVVFKSQLLSLIL